MVFARGFLDPHFPLAKGVRQAAFDLTVYIAYTDEKIDTGQGAIEAWLTSHIFAVDISTTNTSIKPARAEDFAVDVSIDLLTTSPPTKRKSSKAPHEIQLHISTH